MPFEKGKPRPKNAGRKAGTPNKISGALKDDILEAAKIAGGGGEHGTRDYLAARAIDTPGPFLALLGKVLPLQLANAEDSEGLKIIIQRFSGLGNEQTEAD